MPTPSKSQLKRISHKVRHNKALSDDEIAAVQNWRSAHGRVINSWKSILLNRRSKLKLSKKSAEIGQRLKRYPTIIGKLQRHPKMCITSMHDIAGCRVIFKNIDDLHKFRNDILNNSHFAHIRKNSTKYEYISSPKDDGYRGIHDVYECKNPGSPIDGLRVEIQYRTLAQHIWSTTVESIGMMTGSHIKFGQGSSSVSKYFQVCSEIFARTLENKNSCLPDMSYLDLAGRYLVNEYKTGIVKKLSLFKLAVKSLKSQGNNKNFVLAFLPSKGIGHKNEMEVAAFKNRNEAVLYYNQKELSLVNEPYSDVVMVTAESMRALKLLFPNYFLKSTDFDRQLDDSLSKLSDLVRKEKVGFRPVKWVLKMVVIGALINKGHRLHFSGCFERLTSSKQ